MDEDWGCASRTGRDRRNPECPSECPRFFAFYYVPGPVDLPLETVPLAVDNYFIVIPGKGMGGVVVLAGNVTLPEGAVVNVVPRAGPVIDVGKPKRRVVLPLVGSKHPGSIRLSAERIAAILEEDDLSA